MNHTSHNQFIYEWILNEFLRIIKENKFKDDNSVYQFVKTYYGAKTRIGTVTKEYPDVVRRLFIISGFITIRYAGKKFIQINENKLDYIKTLLKIDFNLSEHDKANAENYFAALNTEDDKFIKIVKKYRIDDKVDGTLYTNRIFEIIDEYDINEEKIIDSIHNIGTNKNIIQEFKEIPNPLKLEFYISILVAIKYGAEFTIRPNYKADHIGKPYSHAPGNIGDIEIYSSEIYWLIEVTLIRNITQQLNNETTSVFRHLRTNEEFKQHLIKYLSFVAPVIHEDTKKFYDFCVIDGKEDGSSLHIKPYDITEFVEVTSQKTNFEDMQTYTKAITAIFINKLNK